MLQLREIIKDFGGRRLFAGINWHLRPGDKVGLCGENGAGKTTLLKMLAGQVTPDGGEVQLARGTTCGYLPQDGLEYRGRSLFAEVRSALAELLAMERELGELELRDRRVPPPGRPRPLRHRCRRPFASAVVTKWRPKSPRCCAASVLSRPTGKNPASTSPGAGRCASRWPGCCCSAPTCCSSTNRPTTSTCRPATGWKPISPPTRGRWCWFPTTASFSTRWSAVSSRSGTARLTEYPGNYSRYLEERERRISALQEAKRRQDEEIAAHRGLHQPFSLPGQQGLRWCRAGSSSWRRSNASTYRRRAARSFSVFPTRPRGGAWPWR